MLLSGNVQITRFIIGPNVDFASFAPSPAANVPPNPNAPSSHVRLDVHIFSAPQLDFQNSYAQLAGSVDLRIRGTVAQPAILGRINITDGTANFAGTTYRLQHGEIFFTNPVMIQPIIDIDATTRVEEYDVTIGLHGNLSQLTPTFRSEPPLAAGRRHLPASPGPHPGGAGALFATGAVHRRRFDHERAAGRRSQCCRQQPGAKAFRWRQRQDRPDLCRHDRQFECAHYGSAEHLPQFQVTYATNVNATAQQLIQAQVDVTQSVSLLAVRDESGVFSLVLKVHKRYR